jgi:F420-dependent oxidoreductase-like protein
MRICLMIEGQEGVSWEQWLALADACEQHGFDGLFRSDHYASVFDDPTRSSLDAWATLAGLAARTERIRLGTLVSPATFRHPAELARVVATVDHISGGRVELGLGAGWFEGEHRRNGFPFPDIRTRFDMLEEQLEIVERQWTEERFDFAGTHYALEGSSALPKPLQRPRPPIVMGGGAGPRALALAVRYANEYNGFAGTPEAAAELRRRIDEACERGGRDPATLPLSLMTTFVVGSDDAELLEHARRVLARSCSDDDPAAALLDRGDRWLAGTTREVIERLRELEEAGASRVFLQHLDHDDLESVELIGSELIPALS